MNHYRVGAALEESEFCQHGENCVRMPPTSVTLLEATGIKAFEEVSGIEQKPIENVSMVYMLDKANANAPSKRDGANC